MKHLPLRPALLLALVAAVCAALLAAPGPAQAQGLTETKIKLMAEALRARDAGDYAVAKKTAQELAALAPNDPSVPRLIREIDALAEARRTEQESARQAEKTPGEQMIDVAAREFEKPAARTMPVAPPPRTSAAAAAAAPRAASADAEAEAIAKAETRRLNALLAKVPDQRREARSLAGWGRHGEALILLDGALAALPLNSLTKSARAGLQEEREAVLQSRAKGERKKETEAARAAAKADAARAAAERAEAARVAAPPPDPALAAVAAERAELTQMAVKGRSQYLAGDVDGAQETFRALETRDPDNAEAKSFLTRIARERAEVGTLNREKTRAQLLEEVTKSWQRPGVFQERTRETDAAAAVAPLAKKLGDIVLPSVSFTRVEIGQVVAALSAASEEFDTTGTAPKGVNIVLIDPANKTPTVTLTLRNAPLKRVLDFATEAVGYQYEVQADAVVVRPGGETSTLETAFFPVTRATVLRMTGIGAAAASAPGKSDALSSAGAANESGGANSAETPAMKAFLQQAGVNFEAVPGSSLAYDGSAMIVTQTARNLERIRNILNRYNDVRQVEIEAKFMEVQEGALDEMGVTWNVSRRGIAQINPTTGAPVLDNFGRQIFTPQETYTTDAVNRTLANAFSSLNNTKSLTVVGGAITTATGSTATSGSLSVPTNPPAIPGGVSTGSTAAALASITGFVGEFDVNAVVRALSQKQGTDLLSAPKVTVLSGNPATMTVAQEMRYPQSYGQIQSQVGTGSASGGGSAGVSITAGTPQEFTSRNVGVELKVTPTVEEDDYSISLDLNPRVTEFDGFVEYGGPSVAISGSTTVTVPPGFYQPIFSVRDISTKVTIWDGATIVMGGLTREEVKKVNDKVPILGDLPLLGRLFRSKGESTQKRNLLIFVTANLLSPGGSPKKQNLKNVPASTLFQNPTIVTPASAEPRSRTGGK
jgi:general secretion pathway protein D